jgi:hypothetical protein
VQVILTHADGIGIYISKYTIGMSARTILLGHALLPSTKGSAQNPFAAVENRENCFEILC